MTVSAANLGTVGYNTGSVAGSNQIVIDAIDNQGLSSSDFTMTINVAAPAVNQKPTITGQPTVNVNTNQAFNFTTALVQGSDPDGSVASYTFYDSTPGAGFLTLNGSHISGTSVTVSAANLGTVGYNTGSVAGSNQIVIDAIDNQGLSSSDFLMTINVNAAGTNQAPTVTGQSGVSRPVNTTFNFASLIAGGDIDGSVASYTFYDSTPGAGFLTLNGSHISGTSVTVSAANLGTVGYNTGSAVGSNQIVVDAIDNQGLSSQDFLMTINVTASGANQAPVISGPTIVNAPTGAAIGASQLYTSATDADGSVATLRFWDSTPGTGHLALDGVQISGSFVDIAPSQINRVTYVTGSSAGSNDIVVDAYDNLGLVSNDLAVHINVTSATGNQAPIISGPSNISLATNLTVAGSQLFSTAYDPDGSVVKIRFWDSTPGTGQLTLDGVPIDASFVDIAPAQINRVAYVTGPNAGANDIAVEAFDNQGLAGPDLNVHLSIGGGGNQAPTITGPSGLNFTVNQTIPGSQLYTSAIDSDGSVATIRLWDSTTGTAGYLTLDGVKITSSHVDVAPNQISRVAYVTGPTAGTNAIVIDAIDNQGKSSNDLSVVINVTTSGSASPHLYVPIDTSTAGSTPQVLLNPTGPNPSDIFWNSLEALSQLSNDGKAYKVVLDSLRKLPADQLPEVLKDQEITAVKQAGFLGNVAEHVGTIHDAWNAADAGITAYKNGNVGDALWKGSTELIINLSSSAAGGVVGDFVAAGAVVGLAGLGVAGLPAIAIAVGVGLGVDLAVTAVSHSALEYDLQQTGLDHPLDLSGLVTGYFAPGSQTSPSATSSMVSANTSTPAWTYNADTGEVTSLQATNPALWQKTAALLGLDDTGITPDSQHLVGDASGVATNDLLIGAAGADVLNGKSGDDFLAGLSGNDILVGGPGNDTLIGGPGDDRFVFAKGDGADTIVDFTAGANTDDKIDLTAFANLSLSDVLTHTTQAGANAVIDFGNGDSITLQNVNKNSLNIEDFIGLTNKPLHDFNGDGKTDILWRDDSGSIATWNMNDRSSGGAVIATVRE